jgi:hypothetical protein
MDYNLKEYEDISYSNTCHTRTGAFTKELFKVVAPSIRPELKSLFYNKARDVRNSGIIAV